MARDITKLPMWAQDELARRDRRFHELEAALQPISDPTDTIVDHFNRPPSYLDNGARVRFCLDGPYDPTQPYRGPYVEARVTDDGLYLMAGRAIIIQGSSANTLIVRDQPR